MKKIIIVLVCFVALIGCNPNANIRDIYLEFELLDNPDNCDYMSCNCGYAYFLVDNSSVVPVGTMWTTDIIRASKNSNIVFSCGMTYSLGVSPNNEYQVKFYVDGNLEETRTHIGNSTINFIVP